MHHHVNRSPWRRGPAVRMACIVASAAAMLMATAGSAAASVEGRFHPSPHQTATRTPDASAQHTYTDAPCNHGHKKVNVVDCMAVVETAPDHVIRPAASPTTSALGPADIQSAYHLPSGGGGQTVAIVDAYGDSTAESDLGLWRAHYHLPACTSANGCFRQVDQRGGTSLPDTDAGWQIETSLDLDAVSAACPACNILLIEADTASFSDLAAAEDEAAALGTKYISNSYGGGDVDASDYAAHYNHPGVAVVASTGDAGNVVNYPSSDPNVIAVGGTTLSADTSTARGWSEAAWADGGSGCSTFEPKPSYQSLAGINTGCANRATADISADADPNSGLMIYDSGDYRGWLQVGGTSLSSPLVAAMYALAGPPESGAYPVSDLYDPGRAAALNDITAGVDGDCGNQLCQAGPGWDGPTGLGTPDGVAALSARQHGDVAGQVTDAATGTPIAGAQISTSNGYLTRTDSAGRYDLRALVGTYDINVHTFGYAPVTKTVSVTDGQTTTLNVELRPVPLTTVSGRVTDGSGHGWPVYSRLDISGDPNGPVFTDPQTGTFTVSLPQEDTYTVTVSPVLASGYVDQTLHLSTGTAATLTRDVAMMVDDVACTAPGYGWNGAGADFTGWTGATPHNRWTVTGRDHTWEFDNPGFRSAPSVIGGQFAIADSNDHVGRIDTTLVSPVTDLSGQSAPQLSFDTTYHGYPHGESASVDLSLNGGSTWTTVWRQGTGSVVGHVAVAIPRAAGHANIRVRFHYTGNSAWWWAVDNILVGTHSCVPIAGGLLEGVLDDTGGHPVIGGIVTSVSRPEEFAVSIAAPDDPNVPDGFYQLFSSLTGARAFTVTDTEYATTTSTISVSPNRITQHDWTLTPSS